MASSVGAGRTRTALWALAGLLLAVFMIDTGSCAIARVQLDEDAKTAARFAVQQIAGEPVNQETAVIAYQAAVAALPNDREAVVGNGPGNEEDFRVALNGTITMTVTRTAPTLLFRFVPTLNDFTVAKITRVQPQLGM